jgi:hypothetical protein
MRVYWPIDQYLLLKTRKQSRIKRETAKTKVLGNKVALNQAIYEIELLKNKNSELESRLISAKKEREILKPSS